MFGLAIFYLFAVLDLDYSTMTKIFISLGIAYVGFYAPNLYISNIVSKRKTSIRRAWPDALDLLLICVESGMSAEAAFRKVSEEIGAAVGPAGGGADAHHRRAVLSSGAPSGLREPRAAHRPR